MTRKQTSECAWNKESDQQGHIIFPYSYFVFPYEFDPQLYMWISCWQAAVSDRHVDYSVWQNGEFDLILAGHPPHGSSEDEEKRGRGVKRSRERRGGREEVTLTTPPTSHSNSADKLEWDPHWAGISSQSSATLHYFGLIFLISFMHFHQAYYFLFT